MTTGVLIGIAFLVAPGFAPVFASVFASAFALSDLYAWWYALQLNPETIAAWRELGISGMLLGAFALFVWSLWHDWLVTGPRHRDTISHFETLLAVEREEKADLREANRELRGEGRERTLQLERIASDYKDTLRELIGARVQDLFRSSERDRERSSEGKPPS